MNTRDLLLEAAERSVDVLVLTLREPYASLIAWGVKTIETRPRGTSHRGLLAIHSGKGPALPCSAKYLDRLAGAMGGIPEPVENACDQNVGQILAVVRLTDVRDLRREDEDAACFYAPGRKAWVLDPDVARVAPIPFRGCQGFGRVAAELLRAKAMEARAA
jgi:hypothetical protein